MKQLKKLLIIFLVFSLNSPIFANSYKSNVDFSDNLNTKIHPLISTSPTSNLSDLNMLENILMGKKIIAMGEATHGTKEFFELKHRVFQFLVEKMHCRTFLIEASFGDALTVNDYILNGNSNAKDAILSMGFWTWSTKEVLNMVEWMRAYNLDNSHKEKIKFFGFDMQSCDTEKERLKNYLISIDSPTYESYKDLFSNDKKNMKNSYISSSKKNDTKKQIKELLDIFDKKKAFYISKSSSNDYILQKQYLRIIQQCNEYTNSNFYNNNSLRDQFMAENVEWILNTQTSAENYQVMIWAHNGHISKKTPQFKSMGEILFEKYKHEYYSIGQEFYNGKFRALPYKNSYENNNVKVKPFCIKKSPENSFCDNLKKSNSPIFFLDFDEASQDKILKDWLYSSQKIHSIGAVYSNNFADYSIFTTQPPVKVFDSIFFVQETSASIPLE